MKSDNIGSSDNVPQHEKSCNDVEKLYNQVQTASNFIETL